VAATAAVRAADGVNQRLPLLFASHLGFVTPTAPLYVQESCPRGDMSSIPGPGRSHMPRSN
uniref:Uncharacterized protein n=1 Tax=Moschus moschiferus TaxID=68415 RepID=A0A8C6D7D5_MOSMO